jgi:hypothetical protein
MEYHKYSNHINPKITNKVHSQTESSIINNNRIIKEITWVDKTKIQYWTCISNFHLIVNSSIIAESSISNSHRNWEKGNKNQEIENVQTCFDGDLKLCTIVQIQLMNFCKQWIEMNENRMGLEKDEWLTSFDELVHRNCRSEKNEAC